jgi:hypothetical protein
MKMDLRKCQGEVQIKEPEINYLVQLSLSGESSPKNWKVLSFIYIRLITSESLYDDLLIIKSKQF